MHWVLTAFEADGDAFLREYALPGATAEELRPLVGVPADDPLCDCYRIGGAALAILALRFSLTLPTEERKYYVEGEADEADAPLSAAS